MKPCAPVRTTGRYRRNARRAILAIQCGALPLLAGCGPNLAGSTACSGNNFDEVNLQPGCSTICAQEPCKVWFKMPPGEGNYMVRNTAANIGEFPGGETVFLGSFWQGGHRITVVGSDAPPAYLHVGGGRGSGVGF